LSPADIKSPLDEYLVRDARDKLAAVMSPRQKERYFAPPESYKTLLENVKKFDAKPQDINVGSFVYLDKPKKAFAKGSDQKRGQVFIVYEILKDQNVPRYELMDLAFKKLTSSVYRQNLRVVPPSGRPNSDQTDFYR
jgi:hypothetical protein